MTSKDSVSDLNHRDGDVAEVLFHVERQDTGALSTNPRSYVGKICPVRRESQNPSYTERLTKFSAFYAPVRCSRNDEDITRKSFEGKAGSGGGYWPRGVRAVGTT